MADISGVITVSSWQFHVIFTQDPDTIRAMLPPYWCYEYARGLYILDRSKGEKIGYYYPWSVDKFEPDELTAEGGK